MTRSLAEVSSALVDRTKLVETQRQRVRTVDAYQEAVRVANLRYASGLSAYFEVLDAKQQVFPAALSLVRTQRNQLVAVVNLYKALGGAGRPKRACRRRYLNGRRPSKAVAAHTPRPSATRHTDPPSCVNRTTLAPAGKVPSGAAVWCGPT